MNYLSIKLDSFIIYTKLQNVCLTIFFESNNAIIMKGEKFLRLKIRFARSRINFYDIFVNSRKGIRHHANYSTTFLLSSAIFESAWRGRHKYV